MQPNKLTPHGEAQVSGRREDSPRGRLGGVGRAGWGGRDALGGGAEHRRLVLGELVPGLVLADLGGAPAAGADGEPAALPRDRAEVVTVGVLDRTSHLRPGQVRDDELAGVAVELDAPAPDLEPQRVSRRPGRAAPLTATGALPPPLSAPRAPRPARRPAHPPARRPPPPRVPRRAPTPARHRPAAPPPGPLRSDRQAPPLLPGPAAPGAAVAFPLSHPRRSRRPH